MPGIIIEVCCYNLESAINAQEAGADRIELCADRYHGGTTPSYGTMEVVRSRVKLPVFVMIRPRGGDFLYAREELDVMAHDIQMAKELGFNGVVMGVLKSDGAIDIEVMKHLIALARPLNVTFHRAFDLTPDPIKSMQELVSLGVDRLLTSGQHRSAFEGRDIIKTLVGLTEGKLEILPGAGITEDNVHELLRHTGVREIHVSASGTRASLMKFKTQEVLMGDNDSEYSVDVADKDRIRRFRELVDSA